jgi:hypothetical protein
MRRQKLLHRRAGPWPIDATMRRQVCCTDGLPAHRCSSPVWPLILKLAMDQHTFRIWLKHENMKKFTRLRVLKIIVPSSPGKTRQLSKRNNKEPNISDYGLGAREEYKTYSNTFKYKTCSQNRILSS